MNTFARRSYVTLSIGFLLAFLLSSLALTPALTPPAAADPVEPSPVGLTVDKETITTDEYAMLSATSTDPVENTNQVLTIWDVTDTGNPVRAAACFSGSACYVAVTSSKSQLKYEALLLPEVTSNTFDPNTANRSPIVTINRAPWVVTIETDSTTITTEQFASVSLTLNQKLLGTGKKVFLYDRVSQTVLGVWDNTIATGISVAGSTQKQWEIVAYVAESIDGVSHIGYSLPTASDNPVGLEASSNVIEINRAGWDISLTSTADEIGIGDYAGLTAAVNQSVRYTNLHVLIYDRTNKVITNSCSPNTWYTERECNSNSGYPGDDNRRFVAYVAESIDGKTTAGSVAEDNPIGLEAESNEVLITKTPVQVTLSANKTHAYHQESVIYTATINQSLNNTNYQILFFERGSNTVVWACQPGTYSHPELSCEFNYGGSYDNREIIAYVAEGMEGYIGGTPYGFPKRFDREEPINLKASSNVVTTHHKPFQISLTANKAQIAVGEAVTLTAKVNQPVQGTPYNIIIFDRTAKKEMGTCYWATTPECSIDFTFYAGDPHEYVAYVASWMGDPYQYNIPYSYPVYYNSELPEYKKAESNTVFVARRPIMTTLAAPGVAIFNQPLYKEWRTGEGYLGFVYDRTDQKLVAVCAATIICGANEVKANHDYVSYAASSVDWFGFEHWNPSSFTVADNPIDLQASSDGFVAETGSGYISGNEYEEWKIGVASGDICVCQAGDPIQTNTGHLTESGTDLAIPSRGIALAQTRYYNSSRANVKTDMGYGWTHTWTSKVEANQDETLATVTAEDGTILEFTKENNAWTPPMYAPSASLYYNTNTNRWIHQRDPHHTFIFNQAGKLIALRDQHGNGLDATRNSAGQLTTVSDQAGSTLTYTYTSGKITKVQTPEGVSVTYGYNSEDELTSVKLGNNTPTTFTYDNDHRILTMTTPNGGVTTNVYDAQGRVVEQTDPEDGVLELAYDGSKTTITHPDGEVEVQLFSNGRMVANTRGHGTPQAATTTYTYDPVSFHVVSETDPLGNTTTHSYDNLGRRISTTDPMGNTNSLTYTPDGQIGSVTNAAGHTITNNYDSLGRLVSVSQPHLGTTAVTTQDYNSTTHLEDVTTTTTSTGQQTHMVYDASGNRLQITGANGGKTTYTYDDDGRVTEVVSARGNTSGANSNDFTTTTAYDASGNVTEQTNALGNSVTNTYDANGNVISATDPLNQTTTFTYDLLDRVTHVSNPDGTQTTTTYDEVGRILSVKNALNQTSNYTYDAVGNLVKFTTPSGKETSFTHDKAGQILTETSPRGGVTTFTYDKVGNTLSVTNPVNGIQTTTYNNLYQPESTTSIDGDVATYTYDQLGNLTQTTNPNNTTIVQVYDSENRLLSYTDENQNATTYTYDPAGLLVKKTDSQNRETTYTHDIEGLVSSVTAPGGKTTNYTYDSVGNMLTASNTDGTTTHTYDVLGRTASVQDAGATISYNYTNNQLNAVNTNYTNPALSDTSVGYDYNNAGALTKLTYPHSTTADPKEVTYEYNTDGLPVSVTDWDNNTVDYTYDDDGNITTVLYPNGVETQLDVDLNGDIQAIEALDADETSVVSFDYDVSSSSRNIGVKDSLLGPDPVTYTYNPMGRLVGDSSQETNYGYDNASNLTQLSDGATLTKDTTGAVTALTPVIGTGTPSSYTLDAAGSRVNKTTGTDVTTYGYNAAAQLTEVDTPNTDYTYAYNPDGSRQSETTGTMLNQFVWNTQAPNAQLLADSEAWYVYGAGAAPVMIHDKTSNDVTFTHTDRVGSVRTTTDESGDVVGTASYDAFGNDLSASTTGTRFGYAGEYTDPTGFVYLRARYYDPATASFLTIDPLVDISRDGFGYANNNPLNSTDPSGLLPGLGDVADFAVGSVKDGYNWTMDNKGKILIGAAVVGGGVCIVATAGACTAVVGVATSMAVSAATGLTIYALTADCPTFEGAIDVALTDALLGSLPGGPVLAKSTKAVKVGKNMTGGAKNSVAKTNACFRNSFVAGTLVLLADGTRKPIEEIAVGDEVVSEDVASGDVAAKPVTELISHADARGMVKLSVDNQADILVTDEHPFWVMSAGGGGPPVWVAAGSIEPGALLKTSAGTWVQVDQVSEYIDRVEVYNLTVADYHTYFAGGALSHNAKPDCNPDLKAEDYFKPGPFSSESVTLPAKSSSAWLGKEQRQVFETNTRCHTCGGGKDANQKQWIADHQPPTGLNYDNLEQKFFPHCSYCSSKQGGYVSAERKRRKLNNGN